MRWGGSIKSEGERGVSRGYSVGSAMQTIVFGI